jgi:hypothetical protein
MSGLHEQVPVPNEDEVEDQDDDDDDDDDDDRLTWRSDPKESYSDWTIEITPIGKTIGAVLYNVHKYVLAAGPRRSTYFKGVFNMCIVTESSITASRLELEQSAAVAFPIFLDYIYGLDLCMKKKTAVALRHLANYFGVTSLLKCITEFIQEDTNEENVHIYCREALLYHDTKIVEACMKVAASASQDMATSDEDPKRPSLLVMEMLPHEQQIELLKYSIQKSFEDYTKLKQRWKRVPKSLRTYNIGAGLSPTVMPRAPGGHSYPSVGHIIMCDASDEVFPLFYFDDRDTDLDGVESDDSEDGSEESVS